jgi:hypothetical protein
MARKYLKAARKAASAPVVPTQTFFLAIVAEPGEKPFTVLIGGEPEHIAALVRIGRARALIDVHPAAVQIGGAL